MKSIYGAPGHHLVDKLHEKVEEVHKRGVLEVRWTPGHEGLVENERADEEAKRVARGDSSAEDRLPQVCRGKLRAIRSAARQQLTKEIKVKSVNAFTKSPRYARLHEIDPTAPSSKFRKDTGQLPKEQSAMLIRTRTGHIPLRKHLHRIGITDSLMCRACPSQRETVHHYLMTCRAYAEPRRQLERSLGRAARSMKTLLSSPKALPHLFRYVSATRRFSSDTGGYN